MNQRNVDALYRNLIEASQGENHTTQDIAEALASQGVLVPSALTEEQANTLPVFAHDEAIIAELERIAKGEP